MKAKLILVLFSTTFAALLSHGVYAYAVKCDLANMYCEYNGLFSDIDNAEEEFKMLLEPPAHANFREMYESLAYIFGCLEENPKCIEAMRNPKCAISEYTKKLVSFYEANASKIKDEKAKEAIDKAFYEFKKIDDGTFFEENEK